MWLWDANVVRAFLDRHAEGHQAVISRGDQVGWDNIGLPIVVAAELLEGRLRYLENAYRSNPRQISVAFGHLSSTLQFITLLPLVQFDDAALQVHHQRSLFPGTMSRADRLIAALALAGKHRLVTRNVAHFMAVPGLDVENWIDDPAVGE